MEPGRPIELELLDRNQIVNFTRVYRSSGIKPVHPGHVALKHLGLLQGASSEVSAKESSNTAVTQATGVTRRVIDELLTVHQSGAIPIIVVPSEMTEKSRLCAWNAGMFLFEGRYCGDVSEARGRQKSEYEHLLCGSSLRFRIVSDTSGFRKRDWLSVVAVFTTGQSWQFSGWPFESISDLVNSIAVFQLVFTSDRPSVSSLDPLTAGVKKIVVNPSARHQDIGAMNEFWIMMEKFFSQSRTRRFSSTKHL